MRGVIISAIYGACAVFALTFYAVREWLPPYTPILIAMFTIFVPAMIVSMFLDPETRPPHFDPLILAQALLVAGIFGVAMPFMWSAGSVRLQAIHMFPSKAAVELALDDESNLVQISACEMIVTDRFDFDDRQGYLALVSRPAVATQCLDAMPETPETVRTNEKLGSVWLGTLMSGSDACHYVEALDSLRLPESTRATSLVACALGATDPAHRKCCAGRAAVAYPGNKLAEALAGGRADFRNFGVAGSFIAASWGEETYVSRSGGVERQLGLDDGGYRLLSAEVGCEAIIDGDETVGTTIEWLFSTNSDCIPDDYKTFPAEPRAACVEFLADGGRGENVGAALCEADKSVRARRIEEAKAAKIADSKEFAEVSDAIASTSGSGKGLSDWSAMLDSPEDLGKLSAHEREQMRREASAMEMPDPSAKGMAASHKTGIERLEALKNDPRTAGLFSDDPQKIAEAKAAMVEREREAGVKRDKEGNIIEDPTRSE